MQKEWDATYGYAPVSSSISENFPRKYKKNSKNFKFSFESWNFLGISSFINEMT